MLTAGHTQPADDDLIYVGLYVLVENAGNLADEWIHLTEYKTTEVELNYPGGSENVTFYGNKGVEDLAQDLLDTTALVYNNMNLALSSKADTAATVIDTDVVLNNANEVTGIIIGSGDSAVTRNIAGGDTTTTFPSITQWLNSLTAPTGATIVVDDEQITYTPSGGSPVVITFLQFIHPVAAAIDQDVDAILVASNYVVSNEFYINGEDKFYYIANTGNHLHLTIEAVELDDLSDVVITEVADGEVLQWNNSNSRWENAAAGGISDNFRYALLLTNGFLLPENSAMSTDDRDAYTDTLGVYGAAGDIFWFDNTNDGWFNVATGGTALISFPS